MLRKAGQDGEDEGKGVWEKYFEDKERLEATAGRDVDRAKDDGKGVREMLRRSV